MSGAAPALNEAIEAALSSRGARRAGRETRFLCPAPAHDDHDPSASWNPDKAVWHCHVCGEGGGAIDLARRLGVETASAGDADGLTVAALADAKRLPEAFLHRLGVRDGKRGDAAFVVIPYTDTRGTVTAERKRLALTGGRFQWRRGDHVALYGLDRLSEARAAGYVLLVEGESDAWTCWNAGIAALGVPGASTWRDEWAQHVAGIETVAVWREPDGGGDTLAAKVTASLPDARIIDAPADAKDPSALWIALGDVARFRERMGELGRSARPASELRAEAMTREAREALEVGRALLDADDPLTEIAAAIRALGYAGDTIPPMLAYLALTSRLTERPINLALVASSASGKSFAVDTALRLMPASAYYLLKAGSPRALIYDDDADYQHRTVVIGEADSIPEDGPAASAIRSIAADNHMAYSVTERDERTGAHKTRHIKKPGPTGLITTSIRPLAAQMDTRVLTVSVPDTADYTRAVVRAAAARADGSAPRDIDCAPYQSAQRWLELAGVREVVIPFASQLANYVPAATVRMRRDFEQLLAAIRATAVLRQQRRARDAYGRIVATPADYDAARALMLAVFTTAATGGISATVRETAETVRRSCDEGAECLTNKELADTLGIDKGSASRRWKAAAKLGLVVNRETRKGQRAQLVPGDPLPEDTPALPVASALSARVELPDSNATVQPVASASFAPEPAGVVAEAVAPAVQPSAQPDNSGNSKRNQGATGETVAGLRTNPADVSLPGAVGSDRCVCLAPVWRLTAIGRPRCEKHWLRANLADRRGGHP